MTEFLRNRAADVKFAFRMMSKNRGFTAVAVLSLALGIGANTAIFTLVDAVMLRMLPVKEPESLYVIATNPERPRTSWNYPDYLALRDRSRAFSGVIAYSGPGPQGFGAKSGSGERTEVAFGSFVSANYFEVLGVEPAVGRLFNIDQERVLGGAPYIVLGYDFWRRRFTADPRVVGMDVRINGYPFTIVGVARSGFTGLEVGASPDFYVPAVMRSEVTGNRNWNNRHSWWLYAMGRLKPGATVAQGNSELTVINKAQEDNDRRSRPASEAKYVNTGPPVHLLPGATGYSGMRNRLEKPLWVLMIVVGVVLLIACANVANLMLARAASRRQEIAVRLAMGSGRGRLLAQLLTESTLLAVLGGAAGLVVAYFGVQVLVGLMPSSGWQNSFIDTEPDLRMLGFTFGVSVLTGILFGLAPAVGAARTSLMSTIRQESGASDSRARMRLRKTLVIVQVALSLLLLIGAGLFMRSLRNLHTLDAGFRRDSLLFVFADPTRNGYKGQRTRDFYERLRERVEAIPGVRTSVLASIVPLAGSRWNSWVSVPGYVPKAGERSLVDMNTVSPRFFETFGIPIVLGRDFRAEDSPATTPDPPATPPRPGEVSPHEIAGPKVAIINESMAKKYFAGRNPIGQRFSNTETYKPEVSFEIVGVVKDAHYFGLREVTEPMAYKAIWRTNAGSQNLCIRTTNDPARMIEAVRREVAAIDPGVPVLRTRTMEQQVDTNVLQEKIVATLSTFFGILALLLASVGLYGVMAQSVTRRTREIGIRMALGAQRGGLLWLVLRDSLAMVVIGALIGVPAALALTKYVATFLYGIGQRDPLAMTLATAVLFGVAMFAAYLPARRASRVDPNVALRYE